MYKTWVKNDIKYFEIYTSCKLGNPEETGEFKICNSFFSLNFFIPKREFKKNLVILYPMFDAARFIYPSKRLI